jgi:hypothetical protein
MPRSDRNLGLISCGDVVHDIDVEVFRILPAALTWRSSRGTGAPRADPPNALTSILRGGLETS